MVCLLIASQLKDHQLAEAMMLVIPPFIGNPYNGYINPLYGVDDHPYFGKEWGV